MSGKSKVLNIEIGRRLTKVCLTVGTGKGYQIKSSFTFDTPEGAYADGQINNAVELWRIMRKELRAHNVADVKDAIFTLSSNRIASREVMLPALKESQIQSSVESNAFEWFPVDVSKYSLSYMLLGRTKENVRINVVAVPLSIIESYAALAEQSGLNIVALDFAGNSQYQVLRTLPAEGVTMYVNVEPSSSLATFMENGSMLMQRSFAYGGDEMVAAYVGKEENAYVDAIKKLSISEDFGGGAGNKESLERLVANVARSADFFSSGKEPREIGKVVLMGTCSHLDGLKEAVAERIGVDTLWLEEIEGLAGLANSISGISTYIGCVGSNVSPMSLYSKDANVATGSHKRIREGGNYGILVLAGCIVIAGVLSGIAFNGKNRVEKELDEVNERIDSISYVEDTYQEYTVYTEGAELLKDFYSRSESPNAQLTAFLTELEQKMPSEIRFLSATFADDGVSMSVMVPDFEQAAVAINQLSAFESVEEVSVSALGEGADSVGVTQVQFEIVCRYAVAEEVEEEAQPAEETVDETDEDSADEEF